VLKRKKNGAKIRKIKINKDKTKREESWRKQIRKAVALKRSEIKWQLSFRCYVKTYGWFSLVARKPITDNVRCRCVIKEIKAIYVGHDTLLFNTRVEAGSNTSTVAL
jgi:hypothetical protein